MNKKYLFIILGFCIIFTLLILFSFSKNVYIQYFYFKSNNEYEKMFKEVVGEGLYLEYKINKYQAETFYNNTYWTDKNSLESYLLLRSFYEDESTFDLFVLLDYKMVEFSINQNEKSNKYTIKLNNQVTIYNINNISLSEGYHDLLILLFNKDKPESHYFYTIRTIIVGEAVGNNEYMVYCGDMSQVVNNIEFTHYSYNNGMLDVFLYKDDLELIEDFVFLQYDGNTVSQISGKEKMPFGCHNIDNRESLKIGLDQYDSNVPKYLFLVTNPFKPAESESGVFILENMSEVLDIPNYEN